MPGTGSPSSGTCSRERVQQPGPGPLLPRLRTDARVPRPPLRTGRVTGSFLDNEPFSGSNSSCLFLVGASSEWVQILFSSPLWQPQGLHAETNPRP